MGGEAILIGPDKSLTGNNNKCEDNDLSAFKAEKAEVIFEKDSKNNLVVGSNGRQKTWDG